MFQKESSTVTFSNTTPPHLLTLLMHPKKIGVSATGPPVEST